jgi:hypothetical protein
VQYAFVGVARGCAVLIFASRPEISEYKMKRYRSGLNLSFVVIALVGLSLAFVSAANGSHHVNIDPKTPGAISKNFYSWYIREVEGGTDSGRFARRASRSLKYRKYEFVQDHIVDKGDLN